MLPYWNHLPLNNIHKSDSQCSLIFIIWVTNQYGTDDNLSAVASEVNQLADSMLNEGRRI